MKKINAKMTALLFSFISMAYASDGALFYDSDDEDTYHLPRRETAVAAPVTLRIPIEQEGFNTSSFSRLTWPVLMHIGSYLTVEGQLVLARTNHQHASFIMSEAKDVYAECIVQNTPVPQEIKSILYLAINKEKISEEIAQSILNKINGGFLHHRKSLPPFLQNYFYQITSQDFHRVLDQHISDGSIPSQALLHMETCGTYWVDNQTTQERMDELILDHAKLSYISFQNALQLAAGVPITKYISATENEVRDPANTPPLNSFFALNPNSVLVIDAETSTTLETFHSSLIQNVKHIAFIGSHITHIGEDFLRECINLESLTLPNKITQIGIGFLSNCSGLKTLDLSPLSKVTSIRNVFLCGCTGLTTLDLSPLSNITSIDNSFLSGCSGLTTLDLSALSNVTSIRGGLFLSGCSGLTTLDLSPLSKITSITSSFLYGCKSLTTLDLSSLSNVTSIGTLFLSGCKSLKTLDLSSLSNVTSIGEAYLDRCNKLEVIFVTRDCSNEVIWINNRYHRTLKFI